MILTFCSKIRANKYFTTSTSRSKVRKKDVNKSYEQNVRLELYQ